MSSTDNGSAAGQVRAGQLRQEAGAGQSAGHEQSQAKPTHDEQAAKQASALDEVLDDIETSLQGNAEEYVSGFVQQGGQ